MGSQNWWFGHPRPLLYTSKPLHSRIQWFLGIETFHQKFECDLTNGSLFRKLRSSKKNTLGSYLESVQWVRPLEISWKRVSCPETLTRNSWQTTHPYHPCMVYLPYIWLISMVNVGKYTSPMDAMGQWKKTCNHQPSNIMSNKSLTICTLDWVCLLIVDRKTGGHWVELICFFLVMKWEHIWNII